MTRILTKEVRLKKGIEDVWTALTDPAALAEWLMPNNFRPVVGHRFRFQVDPMGSFSGINECEVLEVDPPRRLVYSWTVVPRDGSRPLPPPMLLTWTLQEDGTGTLLRLRQEGLESLSLFWRLSMTAGWSRMLKSLLPKVLVNVTGGHFTPGAITRRDYRATTVPSDFAR